MADNETFVPSISSSTSSTSSTSSSTSAISLPRAWQQAQQTSAAAAFGREVRIAAPGAPVLETKGTRPNLHPVPPIAIRESKVEVTDASVLAMLPAAFARAAAESSAMKAGAALERHLSHYGVAELRRGGFAGFFSALQSDPSVTPAQAGVLAGALAVYQGHGCVPDDLRDAMLDAIVASSISRHTPEQLRKTMAMIAGVGEALGQGGARLSDRYLAVVCARIVAPQLSATASAMYYSDRGAQPRHHRRLLDALAREFRPPGPLGQGEVAPLGKVHDPQFVGLRTYGRLLLANAACRRNLSGAPPVEGKDKTSGSPVALVPPRASELIREQMGLNGIRPDQQPRVHTLGQQVAALYRAIDEGPDAQAARAALRGKVLGTAAALTPAERVSAICGYAMAAGVARMDLATRKGLQVQFLASAPAAMSTAETRQWVARAFMLATDPLGFAATDPGTQDERLDLLQAFLAVRGRVPQAQLLQELKRFSEVCASAPFAAALVGHLMRFGHGGTDPAAFAVARECLMNCAQEVLEALQHADEPEEDEEAAGEPDIAQLDDDRDSIQESTIQLYKLLPQRLADELDDHHPHWDLPQRQAFLARLDSAIAFLGQEAQVWRQDERFHGEFGGAIQNSLAKCGRELAHLRQLAGAAEAGGKESKAGAGAPASAFAGALAQLPRARARARKDAERFADPLKAAADFLQAQGSFAMTPASAPPQWRALCLAAVKTLCPGAASVAIGVLASLCGGARMGPALRDAWLDALIDSALVVSTMPDFAVALAMLDGLAEALGFQDGLRAPPFLAALAARIARCKRTDPADESRLRQLVGAVCGEVLAGHLAHATLGRRVATLVHAFAQEPDAQAVQQHLRDQLVATADRVGVELMLAEEEATERLVRALATGQAAPAAGIDAVRRELLRELTAMAAGHAWAEGVAQLSEDDFDVLQARFMLPLLGPHAGALQVAILRGLQLARDPDVVTGDAALPKEEAAALSQLMRDIRGDASS